MKSAYFATLSVALMASACSSTPPLEDSSRLTVVKGAALPTPPPSSPDARAYTFGPLDRLSIEVYGLDDLNRSIQADSQGRIDIPLAGELNVIGRTSNDIARDIERRLSNVVRDPRVTVNLLESLSRNITIDGEVEEPGIYPLVGRRTLMQSIAQAKGATEFARLSQVTVFRTIEGRHYAALYDVRAIRAGYYDDPEMRADDVIVVGESRARRIFKNVIESSALLTAPIIALLQR